MTPLHTITLPDSTTELAYKHCDQVLLRAVEKKDQALSSNILSRSIISDAEGRKRTNASGS